MNSLESNLEPELTDVQVIGINSSSFRASGRANSDSSGVKVSAITDKALVEKVENLCSRLSVLEEYAETRIEKSEASSFVDPNVERLVDPNAVGIP